MISQPDLVIAILTELDRQVPGFAADNEFYSLLFRLADQIANAANRANQDPAA